MAEVPRINAVDEDNLLEYQWLACCAGETCTRLGLGAGTGCSLLTGDQVHPSQLKEEQNHFPGYDVIWNPCSKTRIQWCGDFPAGACGGNPAGHGYAPLRYGGRVISTLHPDFRLFNIYFPNGQRGKERLDYKLDFYAHLLSLCDRLHAAGEHVIITGDFNTAHSRLT